MLKFIDEALERLYVTLPEIVIEGIRHRRVVSGYGEYMTVAGPVKVFHAPEESESFCANWAA